MKFGFDDQGMLERIDERTKIVFLCNPNNPTGTYWNAEKLRRFLDAVGGDRIVVVDEAYFEFVERDDYPDGMALIRDYPNLVVFRTFSKMYALAGLRIGYLAGDLSVVDVIRKTCVVYSVNGLAQEAALAALEDQRAHFQDARDGPSGKGVSRQGDTLLGLETVSGEGNYLMIKLPFSDSLAYRKLMRAGVMVRTMTGFRFPNWIRVTLQPPEAMHCLVEALSEIVNENRSVPSDAA